MLFDFSELTCVHISVLSYSIVLCCVADDTREMTMVLNSVNISGSTLTIRTDGNSPVDSGVGEELQSTSPGNTACKYRTYIQSDIKPQ